MNHQTPKMAFSTELAYRCGLRAHELLTIERTSDKRADKRFYADGREKNLSSKFDGMGDGVRYVVTGKGGLTREIFVPKDLAIQLEQRRLPEPIRVRDRGVFYVQKYDLAGGKNLPTRLLRRVKGRSGGPPEHTVYVTPMLRNALKI